MAPGLARAALAAALVGLAAAAGPAPWPGGLARAVAEEDWRTEFEAVCSKTQDAMSLSGEELRALLGRCDRLAPRLRDLDESTRKVYQRRLKQCRDLYDYVLTSRQGGG
jgi:hypothetical protein